MDDDLLLRMSKKIAQLTKVIYHLNNKNEDCEYDMQELAQQYESEIDQVLKESAAKIDAITEQLRQQEANQRQEAAALQVLTTKFDEQSRKDQALIGSQKQALTEKEATLQDLEAALAAAKAETQECVRAGNDNYNRLVAAKLQREADLQEELQQVSDLQARLSAVAAAEARLQARSQELAADKAALAGANQQLQQALMDKALEAAAALDGARQQHARQLVALRQEQQQQLEAMQQLAAAQEAQHKQEVLQLREAAEAQRSALAADLAALQARWAAREPRPEDVATIADLRAALAAREEALRTAEDRMAQLRGEMLLREENYNKHFRNGGMGQRVLDVGLAAGAQSEVMSWMLKSGSGGGGSRSTGEGHPSGSRAGAAAAAQQQQGLAAPGGLMRAPTGSFKRP
ncbi:hypothetical protein OEZ86_000293 [Tetradesmus obliquus]|nr:hypothetical protein OEZ86_000293 [Tetradesmus obliquus]